MSVENGPGGGREGGGITLSKDNDPIKRMEEGIEGKEGRGPGVQSLLKSQSA